MFICSGDSDKGRSPPDKWLSASVNHLMDGFVWGWSRGSIASSVMDHVYPSSGGERGSTCPAQSNLCCCWEEANIRRLWPESERKPRDLQNVITERDLDNRLIQPLYLYMRKFPYENVPQHLLISAHVFTPCLKCTVSCTLPARQFLNKTARPFIN